MHATKSIARVLVIFALVLAATLGMNAQKKDKTMEQQVFYRTVKVDGLSIFYREAGPKNAPVILLLHGLPSSSRMFQPLLTSAPHTPRSYTETAGPPSTAGVPSSPLASRNPWIATRRNRSFTVVSKPPTSKSPACRNRCSAHAESFPPLQLSRIFFILLSKHDPVTRHSRASPRNKNSHDVRPRYIRRFDRQGSYPATFRNLNDYDVGAMVRHPSVLPSSRAHQNMGTRYGSDCDQGQRRPGWACLSPM